MQRLIYISTSRTVISATELNSILTVSRRNNARIGVTGLLVAGHRRFLQALEGPPEAVEATFRRIGADPRHFAVVTLRRDEVASRTFPEWTMGHQPAGGIAGAASLRAIVDALVSKIENPTIRAYFTGFAEVNAAA